MCVGVTGLAFVEKKYDEEAHALADKAENKKFKSGFIAGTPPDFLLPA